MFGYATDETDELMPMPILLAHRLTRALADRRKARDLPWLRPDGKAQVTVVYENDRPIAVDTVVVSAQHADSISTSRLKQAILADVIEPTIPQELRPRGVKYHVNPTGRFVIGGTAGRRGTHRTEDHRRYVRWHGPARRRRLQWERSIQGRSIGVLRRSLGREERRGRGARAPMRGPAGVCDRCRPARVRRGGYVRHGDASRSLPSCEAIAQVFDLTPKGIIQALDLRKPIYRATAAYGHFGRTPERVGSGKSARTLFSWERTDRKGALKRAVAEVMRAPSSDRRNGASAPRRPKAAYAVAALEDPANANR